MTLDLNLMLIRKLRKKNANGRELPKIAEIGPYPPPNAGWSVRTKFLVDAMRKEGVDCCAVNLGINRKIKSNEYIDIQDGIDYIRKLLLLRKKKYCFHIHINGQAVKGPILSLIGILISFATFKRPIITFHGGIEQKFFPKRNSGKMWLIIYLNFLLSKVIICNNAAVKNHIVTFGKFINRDKIFPIPAFSKQYLDFQRYDLSNSIEEYIKRKKIIILCYLALRRGFYVETLLRVFERLKSSYGIILIGSMRVEDRELIQYYDDIRKLEQKDIIFRIENLEHEHFLNILEKTSVFLRSPVSDGVSSSVLEALSLKVPVVASENGKRPKGVVTYCADDPDDLKKKLDDVIENHSKYVQLIPEQDIRDTVKEELDCLYENI